MQFEAITKDQLSDEAARYLEFRFAPLWEALKSNDAIRVPLTNGQTLQSMQMSLRYAAKAAKQKIRVLRSRDAKSLIVVKE